MTLEVLDIFIGVMANVLRIYVIKRFVDVFFDRKDYTWKVQNLLYIIFCLETSLVYNLYYLPVLNILANIAGLILVILPYKVSLSRKVLAIFLIYGVNAIVDSLVIVIFTKYAIGDKVDQMYECITSLTLLLIVFIFERTLLVEKDIKLPIFYQITLGLVPFVSIGIIYFVVHSAAEMKAMIISVIIGFFLINILIFYLYHSLIEYYSACLEKKMFEQMVEVYAYQLDLVQESQNRVKALRHDLKHHIIELTSMAKKKGNGEMQTYLENMEKFMLNPNEYVVTGNQNIDGVLNYMLQKANEILDVVNIKINIPEQLFLNNFNICVIVGNLLDNAIKAASQTQEKFLSINIQTKQGILFIFIENSYSGNIVEENHKIITSQKDIAIHGIGLENVRKVVEMSSGDMKVNYSSTRFDVEILLYLSDIK